ATTKIKPVLAGYLYFAGVFQRKTLLYFLINLLLIFLCCYTLVCYTGHQLALGDLYWLHAQQLKRRIKNTQYHSYI
ncbi:MAG TPA: hypothetical protein VKB95_13510, partial [Chitinophagaceae bacterium]|nr:hypothetical protein [Chitinophagaceae bacterium]